MLTKIDNYYKFNLAVEMNKEELVNALKLFTKFVNGNIEYTSAFITFDSYKRTNGQHDIYLIVEDSLRYTNLVIKVSGKILCSPLHRPQIPLILLEDIEKMECEKIGFGNSNEIWAKSVISFDEELYEVEAHHESVRGKENAFKILTQNEIEFSDLHSNRLQYLIKNMKTVESPYKKDFICLYQNRLVLVNTDNRHKINMCRFNDFTYISEPLGFNSGLDSMSRIINDIGNFNYGLFIKIEKERFDRETKKHYLVILNKEGNIGTVTELQEPYSWHKKIVYEILGYQFNQIMPLNHSNTRKVIPKISIDINTNEVFKYFKLLGFTSLPSSTVEIERRFKKLAKVKHPDKKGTEEDFIKLSEAKDKCIEFMKATEHSLL